MTQWKTLAFGVAATIAVSSAPANAEILAMMNYESKTADSIKALKISNAPQSRQEGIAIMDVDPDSPAFGDILATIPLPPDLIAHHIFFNRDMSKAYMTALGKSVLHKFDLNRFPYRLERIELPGCAVLEDVIFSGDNKTWYVTCMGTSNFVVGNAVTDEIIAVVDLPMPYPHGLAVHSGIDRILVTSTVRASDLGDPGEYLTVLRASTNEVLSTIKVSNKPSPSGAAPVELLFVPGAEPPVAYTTVMYGGTLWTLTWNSTTQDFDAAQVFDFSTVGAGVPLEIYFNDAADRLYVTTASPGKFHIFDIGVDAGKPTLLKTLDTAEGAHHVAFTKDWKYAFVQNSFLNLPGMSDGEITVIDLEKEAVAARIDTLKNMGLNPNLIVLLPEWNTLAGH